MAIDPLAPDLSGLAALARDAHLDVRPVLLRVHTDLFLTAPSRPPDLLRSFSALATALIPVVDVETAIIVARKLAPSPDTPAAVIEALLARRGEIADAVLMLSPHVGRAQLDEIAARCDTTMALAVASRTDLDHALVEQLLSRNDPVVDERIARNASVVLGRAAVDTLLDRARHQDALSASLVERDDLSGLDKAALYRHADDVRRAAILREVERSVSLAGLPRATAYVDDADAARLLDHALRADARAFVEALCSLLGADPREAWRLADDPMGELVAFGLIAAGVAEEDAIRIFLRLDPTIARSVERVFGLAALIRSVPRAVAERMVQFTLGHRPAALRDKATHVPFTAPGGTPNRAGSIQEHRRDVEDKRPDVRATR